MKSFSSLLVRDLQRELKNRNITFSSKDRKADLQKVPFQFIKVIFNKVVTRN